MALVKYGAGIVQISGSIAGDVHARNRFGNYVRPRTKPVNPHSIRQEDIRAILSFFAEFWHGTLTIAQRAAWEVYAAAIPMTNRLGETIYLTGYNHFMRSNTAFRVINPAATLPNAPLNLNLPNKDDNLVCSEEDVAGQTFTFTCNVGGWGIGINDKEHIMLYQGHPQLASRNFFAGPWRYMDVIDATEGAAGTGTYTAVFPFGVAQKVWFQARVRMLDGRVSVLWTLTPRVIEPDP